MKEHLAPESLSAYLDGELDSREKAKADQHLSSCPDCAETLSKLSAAMGSIASLGPVTTTADEHRTIRKAVLDGRPARSGLRLRFPQWALAGGLVLIAVTALAVSFLGPGGSDRQEALTEAAAPAVGGPVFNFSTGEDVDRTVAGLPEVAAGLNRYRAGAGGARDEDGDPATAAESYAGETTQDSGGAAPLARSAPAPVDPAPESGQGNAAGDGSGSGGDGSGSATSRASTRRFTDEAAEECLARVAGTQNYPMVPLVAREASFQGRAAWLLVYAWSPEDSGGAALDQWQSWLVDPTDCRVFSGSRLAVRALYRSFSQTP